MQILFHLMANTGCLPDKVVPQIPTNRMKGEDQETPRICTGHTLDDCLTGIGIPHFISSFLLSEIRQGRSAKHAAETMLLPFVGRVYCVEDNNPALILDDKTKYFVGGFRCHARMLADGVHRPHQNGKAMARGRRSSVHTVFRITAISTNTLSFSILSGLRFRCSPLLNSENAFLTSPRNGLRKNKMREMCRE